MEPHGDQQAERQRAQWQEKHAQSLRDMAGALQMGRETAHAISMQSEQLGRNERMVDETQGTIDTSKRVLRGMTWSGWLYNKFSTAPQTPGTRTGATSGSEEIAMGFICPDCKVMFKSPEQLGKHYGSVHDAPSQYNSATSSRVIPPAAPQQRLGQYQHQQQQVPPQAEDVHGAYLRELEPQLAELKEASLSLGSALDAQNAQLDRLDDKIGRVQHDMKRVAIQANRITGRELPVVFRFRCAFQEVQTRRFLRDVDGEALLNADVVLDGCAFRAYTRGDDSDVWGFQSEKSSLFLGLNRFGNLKVRGADFKSYEQFLVEAKPSTPLFCLASFFGLGGWVALRDINAETNTANLTIIRGSPENKATAAQFQIVNLDDGLASKQPDAN